MIVYTHMKLYLVHFLFIITSLGATESNLERVVSERRTAQVIEGINNGFYSPNTIITWIDPQSFEHTSPLLHWASFFNHLDIMHALFNKGVDITQRSLSVPLATALHFAAFASNQEAVKLLCSHGAMVNVQDARGNTPLHSAVIQERNFLVIQLLVKLGAERKISNNNGYKASDIVTIMYPKDTKTIGYLNQNE